MRPTVKIFFLVVTIGLIFVSESLAKKKINKEGVGSSKALKRSVRSAEEGDVAEVGSTEEDYADPVPDPFAKNPKWSNFVHRVDAISASLKELTNTLSGLLSSPAPDSLLPFAKEFAKHFVQLNDFFSPLHDELNDGAAYTVGLTDLKKLNRWAREPPAGKLDKARLKWIEVNGFAITVHYIFDRLYPEIKKWGLTEADDSVTTAYPTWLQTISGYEGGDKPTYELRQLEHLSTMINTDIDAEGEKGHMIRSLEKILRKHLSGWDPDSDYNIYCFGNNEFGIIHDTFDLLTDAALFLSMADMKHAVLNATSAVLKEWEAQTGGGEEGDITKAASPSDLTGKFETIFQEMKTKIDRKIRIAEILENTDLIIPGPTTFKCDKPPGDHGTEEPTPNQPDGHNPIENPHRIPPGGSPPLFPPSQWGKPKPDPLSPKAEGERPDLDPQSGPTHPLPIGYIDKRPAEFQFAAFSKAYMGYLEAETVLNPDGSCKSTCPDFKRPTPTCANKTVDCEGYRNAYCEAGTKDCLAESKCTADARKCMRTSYKVSFCPSKKPTRIYEWIDINGTLVGKESDEGPDTCEQDTKKVAERWEMDFGIILNAPQYCEVCLCVCDSPMSADGIHWFDLQPVEAEEGFVITSLKFVQKDNIIRLDAEQGKLLENGKVDQSTLSWIPSPTPDSNDPAKATQLGGSENGFRKLGLDMIYGTTKEVITGIKVVRTGDTLHLSAKTTEVTINGSFASGGKSEWKDANYPTPLEKKKKVDLEDRVSSLKQKGPSQPKEAPENKMVVQFDASSLAKDAGQNVIPYFDIQPTRHHTVRKALNAIGILYKTKKGYGGFVSPTITPWREFTPFL
ncbi:unnamed protein product [Allacma fusca]|uniref:Uncharacterized protein n=1 Tax=Allacma fusca TaxID=39272 RepID=A0A8J2LNZ1_9HEXA|nr:unnamed protein product [Allacma fusca]